MSEIDFMQTVTLQVEKMSCGNCLDTVKAVIEGLDGVEKIRSVHYLMAN
ncbi:heavy-metal-associated domain-containing protein [Bacillus sp. FJAT-45037]|nr:heavy-metal-associated domain-containing protein [Bacillus sp. FJAT-45037]